MMSVNDDSVDDENGKKQGERTHGERVCMYLGQHSLAETAPRLRPASAALPLAVAATFDSVSVVAAAGLKHL